MKLPITKVKLTFINELFAQLQENDRLFKKLFCHLSQKANA